MEYQNTKIKGNLAELEALTYLARRGYQVSLPFGENSPYDLVIESPTRKLYRVQVRWSTWKKDLLNIRLRSVSKNYSRTLDLSRIEVFLIYDGEHVYIVPTKDLNHCKAGFTLRRFPPKNHQKIGISMSSSYLDAIQFIP